MPNELRPSTPTALRSVWRRRDGEIAERTLSRYKRCAGFPNPQASRLHHETTKQSPHNAVGAVAERCFSGCLIETAKRTGCAHRGRSALVVVAGDESRECEGGDQCQDQWHRHGGPRRAERTGVCGVARLPQVRHVVGRGVLWIPQAKKRDALDSFLSTAKRAASSASPFPFPQGFRLGGAEYGPRTAIEHRRAAVARFSAPRYA